MNARMHPELRRQAARALLAVLVSGSVVAPLVHSINHRMDHVHGPVARVLSPIFDEGPHSHGDGRVHSHTAARGDVDTSEPLHDHAPTDEPNPFDHGAGSAAHAGLSLLDAPPVVGCIVVLENGCDAPELDVDGPIVRRYLLSPRQPGAPPSVAA